jgi:hypothetical protein
LKQQEIRGKKIWLAPLKEVLGFDSIRQKSYQKWTSSTPTTESAWQIKRSPSWTHSYSTSSAYWGRTQTTS